VRQSEGRSDCHAEDEQEILNCICIVCRSWLSVVRSRKGMSLAAAHLVCTPFLPSRLKSVSKSLLAEIRSFELTPLTSTHETIGVSTGRVFSGQTKIRECGFAGHPRTPVDWSFHMLSSPTLCSPSYADHRILRSLELLLFRLGGSSGRRIGQAKPDDLSVSLGKPKLVMLIRKLNND
jgi:hypothetical protein